MKVSKASKHMIRMRRYVKKFEEAVMAKAFIGTQHPEDHAAIEDAYKFSKERLLRNIKELCDGKEA